MLMIIFIIILLYFEIERRYVVFWLVYKLSVIGIAGEYIIETQLCNLVIVPAIFLINLFCFLMPTLTSLLILHSGTQHPQLPHFPLFFPHQFPILNQSLAYLASIPDHLIA